MGFIFIKDNLVLNGTSLVKPKFICHCARFFVNSFANEVFTYIYISEYIS